MTTYTVYSVDMWGHVPAECCASFECPCINPHDEDMHNDDRCECREDMNARYRLGTIEVDESSEETHHDVWSVYSDAIVTALHAAGYLSDQGRKVAVAHVDGDVVDAEGRCLFYVESEES